jgi:pimeloyl-ACP methyl ester carboxylesterase/DNA-binding CsgD family transcriptional regulator
VRPRIHFCRSADGARIAYAVHGEGPPLVQTPTWMTHLELDWTGPPWAPWLEELSRHHTVVRHDLRGCGLSDRDPASSDLESWVADLGAVVDAAGLDRFALMGLCQGGAIAAAYAARHPERVGRLLVYGSYVQGALVRRLRASEADEVEALALIIEQGWGRETPAYRELFTCMLMPDASREDVRALTEIERQSTSPEEAARLWRAFHRIDVAAMLPQIRVPTLVAHCRGDGMVPFTEGCRLAALVPDAEFLPLDGRNHILQRDEAAWPRFWERAHEFLGCGVPAAAAGPGFDELTEREREVLERIARAESNDEIAAHLGITSKTVRNHITAIFGKLGVRRRAEAIVRAHAAGFGSGS